MVPFFVEFRNRKWLVSRLMCYSQRQRLSWRSQPVARTRFDMSRVSLKSNRRLNGRVITCVTKTRLRRRAHAEWPYNNFTRADSGQR